jgi:hypothetical protein
MIILDELLLKLMRVLKSFEEIGKLVDGYFHFLAYKYTIFKADM